MAKQTIVVSDQQVAAARSLVAMSGGQDGVDPLIAKIATAPPRVTPQSPMGVDPSSGRKVILVSAAQASAARTLVSISGGLDRVDPLIAKIATAKPATAEQRRLSTGS